MNYMLNEFSYPKTINCKGKLISLDKPLIMGILNLTDDSFYDGGKYNTFAKAISRAEQIISQGADIIDIGACSTRPGAELVSKELELERLLPVVEYIDKHFDIPISVDTVWSEVAEKVVDKGCSIINDISAGQIDDQMFDTIARLQVAYILMHSPSRPKDMQNYTTYDNIFLDISKFFASKIETLQLKGVKDIVLDLGFGFGKTIEQNYQLLSLQKEFEIFSLPILTAISRKSMIYKPLGLTPDKVLEQTMFLYALCLENRTNILRVHDVEQTKKCLQIYQLYLDNKN